MEGKRNGFQDWARRMLAAGATACRRLAAAARPWLRRTWAPVDQEAQRLRGAAGGFRGDGHFGGQVDPPAEARTVTFKEGMDRIARRFGLAGWRSGVAVASSAVALLLVLSMALGGRTERRLMPGVDVPEVIGFYPGGGTGTFADVRAHHTELNAVLAFWYSVDGAGNIVSRNPSATVANWVASHHMRMGVLINNVAGSAGSNSAMLTDPTARAAAVRHIVALVGREGYQEVDIDFELLPASVRPALTTFMTDLRQALPKNVQLSMSVFPPLGVTTSLNGAYDYAALAKETNYLVIMLYDHHYDGGPAGPVSPDGWVRSNINWLLHRDRIPAAKLVLAVGVYGYDWVRGGTAATEVPLSGIAALIHAHGARIRRTQGNPHFAYTASDGTPHVVWYQDASMVRWRLQLAEQLGLHGIAIWALGQETPTVWQAIRSTYGAVS